MRPSQSDWIIRECTSALDDHHAFVYPWMVSRDYPVFLRPPKYSV